MDEKLPTIGLLTPARDEENNLPILYDSLARISGANIYWLIIENGSVDRTLDVANCFTSTASLNISVTSYDDGGDYDVGRKLSLYLQRGLLKLNDSGVNFDYVGVADADVDLPSTYYTDLINEFVRNPLLVLCSGVGLMNGVSDGEGDSHVRGNARLWSAEYIFSKGIPAAPSWDSVSKFQALIDGFDAYAATNVTYCCREMIVKQKNAIFYGFAAAYRGVPAWFAVAKALRMSRAGQPGWSYLWGFLKNKYFIRDISADQKLKAYVARHCSMGLLSRLSRGFRR